MFSCLDHSGLQEVVIVVLYTERRIFLVCSEIKGGTMYWISWDLAIFGVRKVRFIFLLVSSNPFVEQN